MNLNNTGPKRRKVLTASDVLEGAFLESAGGDDGDMDMDRLREMDREGEGEGSDDESGETIPSNALF